MSVSNGNAIKIRILQHRRSMALLNGLILNALIAKVRNKLGIIVYLCG